MSQITPQWKKLSNLAELEVIINESKYKPALILKHDPLSGESNKIKRELEALWSIPSEDVSLYIISADPALGKKLADISDVDDATPQIILFADGVTMYDESHDMISFKKIKLALKIVNRTFRWVGTRA